MQPAVVVQDVALAGAQPQHVPVGIEGGLPLFEVGLDERAEAYEVVLPHPDPHASAAGDGDHLAQVPVAGSEERRPRSREGCRGTGVALAEVLVRLAAVDQYTLPAADRRAGAGQQHQPGRTRCAGTFGVHRQLPGAESGAARTAGPQGRWMKGCQSVGVAVAMCRDGHEPARQIQHRASGGQSPESDQSACPQPFRDDLPGACGGVVDEVPSEDVGRVRQRTRHVAVLPDAVAEAQSRHRRGPW